jgi:NAD(P)H-hydrate repair Nnr-like enzyme with NAD(P)H-hydrate dehydratase domain
MVGAGLASGLNAFDAACSAVFAHGRLANDWAAAHPDQALTASRLASNQSP